MAHGRFMRLCIIREYQCWKFTFWSVFSPKDKGKGKAQSGPLGGKSRNDDLSYAPSPCVHQFEALKDLLESYPPHPYLIQAFLVDRIKL